MIKFIDVSGKTEEEAIRRALEQLSLDRDEVSVEILERAKSGFIGGQPALVRVSYDDGVSEPVEEPKKAEEPVPAPVPKAQPKAPMFQPEILQKEVRAKEKAQREEKKTETRAKEKAKKTVDLGEECRDEKSEQIRTFLSGLLEHMESAAQVKVYEVEKGRYKVILEGEKLGALIGRRGETLDAIQQLTSYAVNHSSEKGRVRIQVDAENYRETREQSLERLADKVAAKVVKVKISIDAENYRAKRTEALTQLAVKVANKVVKYRRNVTLEPMNAYERHVIHTALQDTANVSTFSIGTEPNRRVVVSYDRSKQ